MQKFVSSSRFVNLIQQYIGYTLAVLLILTFIPLIWQQWQQHQILREHNINPLNSELLLAQHSQLEEQGTWILALNLILTFGLFCLVVILIRQNRFQQKQNYHLQQITQQLEVARDQAEEANRSKGIFLANISHEIRTPFQGLLGMLSLLNDKLTNQQHKEYLQTAQESAGHLLGLINDILDISTLEMGNLKLSIAPMHIPSIIHEVEGLMQTPAREKRLQFSLEWIREEDNTASTPESEWVMADPTRVRQIMFNLINNAIKFTPQGSITAQWKKVPGISDNHFFMVRDTGVGMDEETVKQLFTRFYQVDNSVRRRISGTGLGLEISRNLAQMMGGDITVSSTPGVGSVFVVMLMLPAIDPPQQKLTTPSTQQSDRSLHVLVAEDHPVNLKYLCLLLESMGHEVTRCFDGTSVLALLKRHEYDAILMDYHMPELDGLATTKAIRAMPDNVSNIPIILMTADIMNNTRLEAKRAGINCFVPKPLLKTDLQNAFRDCGLLEDIAPPIQNRQEHHTADMNSPTHPPSIEATLQKPVMLDQAADRHHNESLSVVYVDHVTYQEILKIIPANDLIELQKSIFEPPHGTAPQLLQALQTHHAKDVLFSAHKLKGVAMLLGFQALGNFAEHLENTIKKTPDAWEDTWSIDLQYHLTQTQQALESIDNIKPSASKK